MLYDPAGQSVGLRSGKRQNDPAGHETQKLEPKKLYVPKGQLDALIEARGQYEPDGQRAGETMPGDGHKDPAGHERQVAMEDAPSDWLNVPAGHIVAFRDPIGQYEPDGHIRGAPLEQ